MTQALERSLDAALVQRIRAAAEVLLGADTSGRCESSHWADVAELLYQIVADLQRDLSPQRIWLLWAAISTAMPESDDVRDALRIFELSTTDEAMHWLLESCLSASLDFGSPNLELTIVQNAVVVDVDFSARYNLHTGIQRVARELVPRWDDEFDILPVAWTPSYGLLRTLVADERDRVLRWHGGPAGELDRSTTALDSRRWSLVLPWNCVVVLTEVPFRQVSEKLAGLAEHSGNRLVGIGYDCIPVISADLVPPAEPNRFVRYLSIVKHMRRVAGISVSATQEFQGFARALTAQGLAGPTVLECRLPNETVGGGDGTTERSPGGVVPDDDEPTILCVGSFEPRKNQIAVLYAAETLWREGHKFRVRLIGGTGWGTDFNKLVKRLRSLGRHITVNHAVSDGDLERAFRSARFSIFASLHEGYGLPVAESLAFDLPVITANYGSTAEIAASGGALLIDPRDDIELTQSMRDLLTDDKLLAKLRSEMHLIGGRTWDDYSRELWHALVEPERREVQK